jgi:hypothetical protein
VLQLAVYAQIGWPELVVEGNVTVYAPNASVTAERQKNGPCVPGFQAMLLSVTTYTVCPATGAPPDVSTVPLNVYREHHSHNEK